MERFKNARTVGVRVTTSYRGEFAQLAAPLTLDDPCGASVEYDPQFLELEQEVQGKPEVEYGANITQAVPPDWQSVMALVLPLMQQTRDLRLALILARAQLNLNGIVGFAAGLALIEDMLVNLWDSVHPQLDPDDGNDPLLRINILASLRESGGILRELRDTPLAVARALGSFSLRDIDIATGELPTPPGQEKPSLAVIDAAFQEAGQPALAATHWALLGAVESSVHIERILTEKVGVTQAIDLGALTSMLRRASECVGQRLTSEPPAAQALVDEVSPVTAPIQPPRGEISNREDVRQMLDKICAYYTVHEPTSPVPLLLQRARKLLDKSFIELLQDLAPDGLAQLAVVSGIRKDD